MINENLDLKVDNASKTLIRLGELKRLLDTESTELGVIRKSLEKLQKDFELLRDNGIESRLIAIRERILTIKREISVSTSHGGSTKYLDYKEGDQRTGAEKPIADFGSKSTCYQGPNLEKIEYEIYSNKGIPDNIRSSLLYVLHCLSAVINGNDSSNCRTSDERIVNVLSHFGLLVEVIKSQSYSRTEFMTRNL